MLFNFDRDPHWFIDTNTVHELYNLQIINLVCFIYSLKLTTRRVILS